MWYIEVIDSSSQEVARYSSFEPFPYLLSYDQMRTLLADGFLDYDGICGVLHFRVCFDSRISTNEKS